MKFSPSTNSVHLSVITARSLSDSFELREDDDLLERLKLLPNDIDFDCFDGHLNSILYLAASQNHIKTIEYLLKERRVNPNITVSDGLTALHVAAHVGCLDAVKLLLDDTRTQLDIKDDFGELALFRAIGNAPKHILFDIVSAFIPKMTQSILEETNEDGLDLLSLSTLRHSSSVIQLLLNEGAKVSDTCYHIAGDLLIRNSRASSNYSNSFYMQSNAQTEAILESSKLIIETYNNNQTVTLVP